MRRKDNKFRSDSKVGKHWEEIKRLYEAGLSTNEIGSMLLIDGSNIFHALRSRGIKIRNRQESTQLAHNQGRVNVCKGRNHRWWKGGRSTHSNGYILISQPGHHRADCRGYVPEHVLVAEKKIGRALKPNEIVHHNNHIRTDNRPENLDVMTNVEHGKMHGIEGARARWRNHVRSSK